MFILNPESFHDSDFGNILEFIDYWGSHYEAADQNDDYLANLNIGQDLTKQNIEWLIGWKLPRPNEQLVNRARVNIDNFNKFRIGELEEKEFIEIATRIYTTGHVLSLIHI